MGDAGSIPLGFLSAALGILGWRAGHWPLWFPLLVFSPFVVDASLTLARRVLRGERFWQAHRSHYYQRLVQLGWGHRNTALAEYALMAACGGLALWALGQTPAAQWMAVGTAVVAYLVLAAPSISRGAGARRGLEAMLQRINWRASVAFLHDVAAAAAAWALAYLLRFNLELHEPYSGAMLANLGWVVAAQTGICLWLRMYRGLWRFASLPDLRRILVAAVLGTMTIAVGVVLAQRPRRAAIGVHPLPGAARDDHGREPARLPRVEGRSSQPHGERRPARDRPRRWHRGREPAQERRPQRRVELRRVARRRSGEAPARDPGRACPRHARGARADRVEPRCRARGDCDARRIPPGPPPRGGALPWCRAPGDDGPVLRGSGRGQGHRLPAPQSRARRSARPRPGGARRRGATRLAHRPHGARYRRGRLDRRRALPPDPALRAGAARGVGDARARPLHHRTGVRRPERRDAARLRDRRRPHEAAHRRGDRGAPAVGDLPRRGVQARAADGGRERVGGGAQQCARHLARRGRGSPARRGEARAHLDRQGGQPDQRHGRLEAARRAALPAALRRADPVRVGAVRQRARVHRQRHSEVPQADRRRRAGDGDASRDPALLHVDPRGRAAGAAGGADGPRRRDLRARHGRAGEDRRSRARADPPLRALRERRADRVHRPTAGREALSRSCSPTTSARS